MLTRRISGAEIGDEEIRDAHCLTMRAWPVARSIFDAPLREKSKQADNKLNNALPVNPIGGSIEARISQTSKKFAS